MPVDKIEDESDFFFIGTLAEMIDKEILDHCMGGENLTDGFSIGKRGKAKFWMWDPTPNGFYKLYQQNEAGELIGVRYVDANKTKIRVFKSKTQTNVEI